MPLLVMGDCSRASFTLWPTCWTSFQIFWEPPLCGEAECIQRDQIFILIRFSNSFTRHHVRNLCGIKMTIFVMEIFVIMNDLLINFSLLSSPSSLMPASSVVFHVPCIWTNCIHFDADWCREHVNHIVYMKQWAWVHNQCEFLWNQPEENDDIHDLFADCRQIVK